MIDIAGEVILDPATPKLGKPDISLRDELACGPGTRMLRARLTSLLSESAPSSDGASLRLADRWRLFTWAKKDEAGVGPGEAACSILLISFCRAKVSH